ncbi:D-alanine--D-alanine ligase A [Striga asiatica]|uniref:D-alanine--D-alanine ligase A n=1 Tax=Striga asiatica TaxID=4170 RepID=A0A5A7PLU8_STRAF|nr:D-alanine--D-alanine ligase A [Striga asiatica]
MKPDGKILEYKSPIKVHQVLSEFTHHSLSDRVPVSKHMHPNADLAGARLYYLLPLPVPPPQKKPAEESKNRSKKRVRFTEDVKGGGSSDGPQGETAGGAVRIKIVISKQELQAMLQVQKEWAPQPPLESGPDLK